MSEPIEIHTKTRLFRLELTAQQERALLRLQEIGLHGETELEIVQFFVMEGINRCVPTFVTVEELTGEPPHE